MKKAYIFLTAFILLGVSACGEQKGDISHAATPSAITTPAATLSPTATPTVAATVTPVMVPTEIPAELPGTAEEEKSFEKALNAYLTAELGQYFAPLEHCIPFTILVDLDDRDKDNVKVYGIFWVQDYRLNGTVLENVSGGSFPGVIKGKETDGIWEFTGMERVVQGSGNAESAKKIFGDRYDVYTRLISDDDVRATFRTEAIKNYVKANDLNVTAYKDYGCDPIEIAW